MWGGAHVKFLTMPMYHTLLFVKLALLGSEKTPSRCFSTLVSVSTIKITLYFIEFSIKFTTDTIACDTVDRVQLSNCLDVDLSYPLHLYGQLACLLSCWS